MNIITYNEIDNEQIIDLVLNIQNNEAKINLGIEEQADLLNIYDSYEKGGGEFWIAIENDEVIGTVALMNKKNGNSVLKKFFVRQDWRNRKIGYELYKHLLDFAQKNNMKKILLNTPSVAQASHKFYERAGFKK